MEPSDLVQAGGVVVAGVGHALVDVHLAARSLVSLETLALEGAFGVEAAAAMLTRIGTYDSDTSCQRLLSFAICVQMVNNAE